MPHSSFSLSLIAFLFWMNPAHAEDYSLTDLKALVQQKEYPEALRHLKDIRPTLRNGEWNELAVLTLLGNAEIEKKDSCRSGLSFLKQAQDQFASVAQDPRILKKRKELLSCVAGHPDSQEEKDETAKELLQGDSDSIVFLVTDGGHTEPDPRAFQWIIDHPEKAKLNEKLKKYAFRAAGIRKFKDTPADAQQKIKALQKAGWYAEWIALRSKELSAWSHEIIDRAQFDHEDSARMVLGVLHDAGIHLHREETEFLASFSLMRGSSHSDEDVARLKTESRSDLDAAQTLLVQSKPTSNFWFTGRPFTPEQWKSLQGLFPKVVQLSRSECQGHQKSPEKDPVHVSAGACDWILKQSF